MPHSFFSRRITIITSATLHSFQSFVSMHHPSFPHILQFIHSLAPHPHPTFSTPRSTATHYFLSDTRVRSILYSSFYDSLTLSSGRRSPWHVFLVHCTLQFSLLYFSISSCCNSPHASAVVPLQLYHPVKPFVALIIMAHLASDTTYHGNARSVFCTSG